MIVSYPNNPTAVLAPDSFYEELIAFAKKYDIIVLHDNAYSELVFDGRTCGSFLRFPGAREVGVEFNSLSKTYGLAGARVAAYERRRDCLCDGLASIGWKMEKPEGTMFVWAPIPAGFTDSLEFVKALFEKAGVLVTPGSAFGPSGEGHVRMALVQDEDAINLAVHRIDESGILK